MFFLCTCVVAYTWYTQVTQGERREGNIIRNHRFLSRSRENEKLKGRVNDMRSCRVVSTGTIFQFPRPPLPLPDSRLSSSASQSDHCTVLLPFISRYSNPLSRFMPLEPSGVRQGAWSATILWKLRRKDMGHRVKVFGWTSHPVITFNTRFVSFPCSSIFSVDTLSSQWMYCNFNNVLNLYLSWDISFFSAFAVQ